MKLRPFRAISVAVSISGAVTCQAQWKATVLWPTPGQGPQASMAQGAWGGQQVGQAEVEGVFHASLWSGTADSWVDLGPRDDGVMYISRANAVAAGQQVGYYADSAALWTGSASSRINLHPGGVYGYAGSEAFGVADGQQVGYAKVRKTGNIHAGFWMGTAASWVDLNPLGYESSVALAVSEGEEAGCATLSGYITHAGFWNGSSSSWVDLNPDGATQSIARGVSKGQQVGEASMADGSQAAVLWNGNANSWVNLSPAGSRWAGANAIDDGLVVGYANGRAALWTGSADSIVDLGSFLPTEYKGSQATGVYHDANNIFVVGWVGDGLQKAVVWQKAVPEPATMVLVGLSLMGVLRRRPPGSSR